MAIEMLMVRSYKLYEAHIMLGDKAKDECELKDLLKDSGYDLSFNGDFAVIESRGEDGLVMRSITACNGDMLVKMGDNVSTAPIVHVKPEAIDDNFEVIWRGLNEPEA